jgi:hypothetical protein
MFFSAEALRKLAGRFLAKRRCRDSPAFNISFAVIIYQRSRLCEDTSIFLNT